MKAPFAFIWESFCNAFEVSEDRNAPKQKTSVVDFKKNKNQIAVTFFDGKKQLTKLKVSFAPISETIKESIVNEILNNKELTKEILANKYPIALAEILKKLKVNFFTKKWTAKNLSCSCSSWTLHCTHINALIKYLKEFHSDTPKLIFKLCDFQIFDDVKLESLTRSVSQISIPNIHFLLNDTCEEKPNYFNYDLLKSIDFTVITDIKPIILSVLEKEPVFHEIDFKSVLYSAYQDISIGTKFYINNFYNKEIDAESKLFISSIKHIKIELNDVANVHSISYYDTKNKVLDKPNTLNFLIKTLESVSEKKLLSYCPEIIALYNIYLFAIELLINSSYTPQLFQVENNEYRIRWIPKVLNQASFQVFNALSELIPPDILFFSLKNSQKKKYQKTNEICNSLTSIFLEYFISRYIDQLFNSKKIQKDDKIFNLFFKNESFAFNLKKETSTPLLIYDWLKKLYITQKDFSPAIKVEEFGNKYNIELLISKKDSQEKIKPEDFTTKNFPENICNDIKSDIELLTEYIPDLEEYTKQKKHQKIELDSEQFVKFLLETIPIFRLFGMEISLPEALNKLNKPQLTIQLKTKNNKKISKFVDLEKMLDYDWKVVIGNDFLEEDEFRKLIEKTSGIIKYKESFIYIKKEEVNKILKDLSSKQTISSFELAKAALSEEFNDSKVLINNNVREVIEKILNPANYELPNSLNAELRPYQRRGYEWLLKNIKFGLGCLIADDMGLGKTLQVLSAILKIKEEKNLDSKQILIIVPTTLLTNWRREVEKFTPELKTYTYYGTARKLETDNADIVFTSYGTLRQDINTLKNTKWLAVIIDEAQNIKNDTTSQALAIRQLQSDVRIAMSGTPVENRLTEYWSIVDFLNKGIFGTKKQFVSEFATPIQLYRSQAKLNKFRKITQPFILRRLKSDKTIINDLPDKIENNQYCALAPKQAAMYKNLVNFTLDKISHLNSFERKGIVLQMITGLKQICNHPAHYSETEELNIEDSGKITSLFNLLETIYENNEKVLIFTQYKQMGDLLVKLIEKHFQTEVLFLNGSVSQKNRVEMIDKFQTESSCQTFILSLKAGGLGLNLTQASNVIHFDLWWNPATEAQATDRAYRIGQDKNVMVYRLICKGTFEEKIDEMLNNKKQLAEMTVVTGEKWIGDLSETDIKNIFELK